MITGGAAGYAEAPPAKGGSEAPVELALTTVPAQRRGLDRTSSILALLLLLLPLTGCAPGAAVLAPPTFQLDGERSGFVSIDPPGVGDASALFRLYLLVGNPNPVAARLSALDGTLNLRDVRAAGTSFRGAVQLPANGAAPLLLDIKVPLGAAPAVMDALAALVAGESVDYRFDAAVTIDVLGSPQRFPAFTLVRGQLPGGPGLVAPRMEFASTGLRFEAVGAAVLDLQLALTNPGVIGYVADVADLVLSVGGAEAAHAELPPTAVPGGATVRTTLSIRFAPLELGEAIAEQIQAGAAGLGGVSLQLAGAWRLEAPGLITTSLGKTTLLRGALR